MENRTTLICDIFCQRIFTKNKNRSKMSDRRWLIACQILHSSKKSFAQTRLQIWHFFSAKRFYELFDANTICEMFSVNSKQLVREKIVVSNYTNIVFIFHVKVFSSSRPLPTPVSNAANLSCHKLPPGICSNLGFSILSVFGRSRKQI